MVDIVYNNNHHWINVRYSSGFTAGNNRPFLIISIPPIIMYKKHSLHFTVYRRYPKAVVIRFNAI